MNHPALFLPSGVNQPRMLLWLVGGMFVLQLALNFRDQWRFFQSEPARVYGPPPRLLGRWRMPELTSPQFVLCGLGLLVALLAALAGWQPRVCLLLATALHLLYFSQLTALSYVQRKPSLLALVLLILAAAPGLDAPLDQPMPEWPVLLVKLALAQMYFSAGLQKLRRAGWTWAAGETLQSHLAQHHLWADSPAAWSLAGHLAWCRVASGLVLAWELTFGLILIWPALTPLYVAGALAFHTGTAVLMRIEFWRYLSPVYMVFLTDAALQLWGVSAR